MQGWLETMRPLLTQAAAKALKSSVANNRSGLPPFRLPQIAQQILTGLAEHLERDEAEAGAQQLGHRLGQQGLGLRSLLAVSRALVREALAATQRLDPAVAAAGETADRVARLQAFMTLLIDGLAAFEMEILARQRDEMQLTLERAVQGREQELRRVIHELSTPVMPLFDQILVLPLIGSMDSERAQKITERMLAEISERRARIVIIDITGVPSLDAELAAALVRTTQAAQLLGTRPVLVGIRAELAKVLAQLDVDLQGLLTLANLQSGLAWAMQQQGLTICRKEPRSASPAATQKTAPASAPPEDKE